ncbi:MAG: peptide deformylase [Halobacteriovoraceae bacterium]|nr:peptide deformylase [Halobacteriovoraceae bacterium]
MEDELKEAFSNHKLAESFPGNPLKIFTYPAPVLKVIAKPVTEFNEELKSLVIDMLHTMYNAPGIGLAAPQVGKSLRFFVSDIDFETKDTDPENDEAPLEYSNLNPKVFINPKIKKSSGEIIYEEGCLSVPGVYEEVKRYENITLEYQDLSGKTCEIEAEGLRSVCLQHELDHLNGIVFIEKLNPMKKMLITKKFLKKNKQ